MNSQEKDHVGIPTEGFGKFNDKHGYGTRIPSAATWSEIFKKELVRQARA